MGNLIIRNGGNLTIQGDSLSIINTSLTSGQLYTADGVSYGFSDFSEFSVASGLPTGLSAYQGSTTTFSIANDVTEGNYIQATSHTTSTGNGGMGFKYDAFVGQGAIGNDIEILYRTWFDGDQSDYIFGAFNTIMYQGPNGEDVTSGRGVIPLLRKVNNIPAQWRPDAWGVINTNLTSSATNWGSGLQLTYPFGEPNDYPTQIWTWVRARITYGNVISDRTSWKLKWWTGSYSEEPVSWDGEATAVSDDLANTPLNQDEFGFLVINGNGFWAQPLRISYFSFSTDPDTIPPPTP
jgi:hypothetical protein